MGELVSIVIPVYQAGKYFHDCLQSIQKQSYKNIEIILIDDGSTDGSSEICDEIAKENYNIVVFHQKNSGVSTARNKGIELASGKYIIFIDSDDYIEPDIISVVVQSFEHLNIDLSVFGFQMISEENNRKFKPNIPFACDQLLSKRELNSHLMNLFLGNVLHAIGTKVYKKSIIDKNNIRFQDRWEYYEDIYFCLSYITKCEKVLFMNKVGYYYRIGNPDSLSNKETKNGSEAVFETFCLIKNMIGSDNWNEKTKEKFYRSFKFCIRNIQNRECGKSDDLVNKYRNMFIAMNSWINNCFQGVSTAEYLIEKGFMNIAIYGMNYMGITLLNELANTEIKVLYAIDQNADNITSAIRIYNPNDEFPVADAIIVTAISSFTEIKEFLNRKGVLNVISLEDVIYSI